MKNILWIHFLFQYETLIYHFINLKSRIPVNSRMSICYPAYWFYHLNIFTGIETFVNQMIMNCPKILKPQFNMHVNEGVISWWWLHNYSSFIHTQENFINFKYWGRSGPIRWETVINAWKRPMENTVQGYMKIWGTLEYLLDLQKVFASLHLS